LRTGVDPGGSGVDLAGLFLAGLIIATIYLEFASAAIWRYAQIKATFGQIGTIGGHAMAGILWVTTTTLSVMKAVGENMIAGALLQS
jgi:hypothetical protein